MKFFENLFNDFRGGYFLRVDLRLNVRINSVIGSLRMSLPLSFPLSGMGLVGLEFAFEHVIARHSRIGMRLNASAFVLYYAGLYIRVAIS